MQKPSVGFMSLRLLGAGILTLGAGASFGAGFALIEQSASQMGNAFAGSAAIASDASTLYFNPAGMTRLPRQLVAGVHAVATEAKYSGTATDLLGTSISGAGGVRDAGGTGVVPNFYLTLPVHQRFVLGLGVSVPFGLSTEYDDGWIGRYQALDSEVTAININPSIAFKLTDALSLGLGVNYQYMSARLTQAIDQGGLCTAQELQGAIPAGTCAGAGLAPQASDAKAEIEGDGWAGGFNFGLLYELDAGTRLGFSYRSKIRQRLTGDADFTNASPVFTGGTFPIFVDTDASAGIDLPKLVSASIYHELDGNWAVMADVTWTGWSSFRELRVEYDGFQPDTVVDEDWNDSWRYALGVSYRVNSNWLLRTGVAFDQSPIPDDAHRTARIPGEDRTWLALGLGYRLSETVALDVGYAHLFVKDPGTTHGSASTGFLNGEYDAAVDIFSAQLVWNL
ncbi:MAG TPA: hypothetical protein ENJ79_02325 [Gammaproteobacteria bacterium]|nr:hypothetical protein [Gammaproteobacteria bacterium]